MRALRFRLGSRRWLAGALAALGCCGSIAACGSSGAGASGTGTNAATGGKNVALEFSQCMRAHGVSNFPDPGSGGGLQIGGTGLDPNSPVFQSAQKECSKYLPKGGPANSQPTAAQKAQALALSRCIRAHGYPSFPDPTYGSPQGSGPVLVIKGAMFNVGASFSPRSPAFRRATSECGLRLPTGKGVRAIGQAKQ